jgi:hypothetical protein
MVRIWRLPRNGISMNNSSMRRISARLKDDSPCG